MAVSIRGNSGIIAEVNSDREQLVKITSDPTKTGSLRFFTENDDGSVTGTVYAQSPETDDDYRLRTSSDLMLDVETFNYTAQNTGKHTYANATMTITWGTGGLTTNGGNVTTTGLGATLGTYAEFPIFGTGSLYCEMEGGFSNQPVANAIIDFGMFRRGASAAYAPTDGVYFRLTSAGVQGVINNNGSETATTVFDFAYTNARKYQFIITVTQREIEFWIDNVLYATLDTPAGQGQPFMSGTLPFSLRHAHTGTAGGVINFTLNNYTLTAGGPQFVSTLGEIGNRTLGSYQGLSGGTMGSLSLTGTITTGNSANPTAAVPTTTTAALGTGLGGRFWETFTLAVNTDGIIQSYQVPAGTVSVRGQRLRISGIYLSSYVQTVIAGGPLTVEWFLAFGHTAVSLATAEAATTKAPRRICLPFIQQVTAAQAVNTTLAQNVNFVDFSDAPIYVNPGEFIQLCKRHIGTVGTSGTIVNQVTFIHTWE